MLVFPLIPPDVRAQLPNQPAIDFVHPHNLGSFSFNVQKSPSGFNVTVKPVTVARAENQPAAPSVPSAPSTEPAMQPAAAAPPPSGAIQFEFDDQRQADPSVPQQYSSPIPEIEFETEREPAAPAADFSNLSNGGPEIEIISANDPQFATKFSPDAAYEPPGSRADFREPVGFVPPLEEYVPPTPPPTPEQTVDASPLVDRRNYGGDRRQQNSLMQDRMDALFRRMADEGASDLHLSVSMPPMVRKDGKMRPLECSETTLSPEIMSELLRSIMPEKNRAEFDQRHDTDFAYEIAGLARFRCNVFMDRKGMGAVFRIIPTKILTAEQLGLSKAIMDLCSLSKGLVVVTGPTGSGKSTTLCAMVDHINKSREDHIITIEDPIEFVHDNHQCLVNQREVHNHTDSFKDALRAALREDPDILLVGEMRDLETISIAIETAETGHLVFGTLHTTTAASTVDRIIDQFPADRQQQIRVMLSESLKGVIAQTLLPKKGGGRVAALEVLIVTPAISNLIREGKTFQIPSAMQTGKNHGMVMLNDALFDHVQKGLVEPRDAYIKAVDKAGFEMMLTRGGFKL
jgi:twitching motility protein PilT